ncbi:NUDIX hydrolase [Biformimicrobium ophioploci]|uniref:NUDIX hydrolase n=1 Tax=Biformimicrobium ophioploci TaxID=3036711 RepID=A0ABQ6LXQ6_9GAMM|nr:NUDIX hydrolase [Microbulbifer sp. NKW57]GMG86860.1 NUDIX hydrolase [Microbulbifer sp. NKW57]
MIYCSHCGSDAVEWKVPADDNRPRHCCNSCGMVHYINPRVIVGTLPYLDDKVLLCKRAIEPRKGYWTLPAGFMENGESSEEGALRETREEAHANVAIDDLYCVHDIPEINQVYLMYLGRLTDTDFGPGPESTEVELFSEEEIPWAEMAFPVMVENLRAYFEDRKSGNYRLHRGVIYKKDWEKLRARSRDKE